jgi:hypothetical protein
VLALARVQFETAAVNFFVSTLQVHCRRYVAAMCATASHTRCSFAAPSAPSLSGASTASPATTTPLASTPLLPARSAGAPPPLMLLLHLGVEMTMLQLPPPSHGPRASSAERQGLRNRCCQWRAVPQRVSGCRHEHLHRCARQRRLHRRGGGGGGALGAGFVALRSAARACLRQAQLSRRTR